ncbi:MAG: hypothetical protein QHI48_06200 [Bacteroidota bacterium]|nr:hypothetical protein [Bacteroidota bacterium]
MDVPTRKRDVPSPRLFERLINGGTCAYIFLLVQLFPFVSSAQELSRIGEIQPFSIRGSVSGTMGGNSISGLPRRQQPFSWMLSGAATATVYDVEIPFSFVFAERERSYHQPFDEFGLSPTYKWVRAHLGYRSLTWSRYSVAGIRFAGAAVELFPKDFQFALLYGRLARAVEQDSTNPSAAPAYRRTGWGAMAKIGNEDGFFRISLFQASDDTNSLARRPSNVLPQENTTGSFEAHFVAFDWLSADLDVGASFLTRNLYSPPLTGGGLSGSKQQNRVRHFKRFFDVRTTSTLAFAARAGVLFRLPWAITRIDYEIIEPEFTSFGAYYFNSDVQNITVSPSFHLFNGALRIAASAGVQSDNVGNTKAATTTRLITSANIGWSPNRTWNIDAAFSNYATSQASAREALNDSIRVRNVNTSLSLTPRMMLESSALRHVVTVSAIMMQYDDMNILSGRFSGSTTKTASVSYFLGVKETPWSAVTSASWSNTETAFGETKNIGFSVGGSTSFFEGALQLSLVVGYSRITVGSAGASGVVTQSLAVGYRASADDQLSFTYTGSQNGGGSQINPVFREHTAMLHYTRAFSWSPSARRNP